ncbi:hypothetical protein SAMN02746066_04312 [Anaerosporobacter mobilis DSM 15930]|uniref:Ig-like domain (Group 2) n=1 Tax=Anaerosporobacter mobilis DSM 15930 TaxID=1120996 RepID=A0A1M7NAN9_9FIRM|nr:hypothetical protein [Anaerosporobacter mobilis]SHN00212.1 hypothetical protein SAMN02746066_04312 [Anaerosporobacter mobilis DSM 15930]
MKNHYKIQKRFIGKLLCTIAMVSLLIISMNSTNVQAATKRITLYQYHPNQEGAYDSTVLGQYYYDLYPSDKYYDYKNFMKYTYKISDDSVIGLAINKGIDYSNSIIMEDDKGNPLALYPYDIKVIALGPGTSTLKVYSGKKLIDSYSFVVVADKKYSPSSYVNNTGDVTDGFQYASDEGIAAENKLIKQFAKIASEDKYTTTNQRVLAVLNAVVAHECKLISEEQYEKWEEGLKHFDFSTYRTAYSRLVLKKAVPEACAIANKAILNNLGFRCAVENQSYDSAYNTIKIYEVNEDYEEELKDREENPEFYEVDEGEVLVDELIEGELSPVSYTATTKLSSDYDFTSEKPESIYTKTHLPAWIIGEDTTQQVIDVGQTVNLRASDMNGKMFSSDTSVVTAEDGKITGVKPGVAIVCRYNDTYCDVSFVLVSKKGSIKTVQTKIYTKSSKSYFTTSDYAPYLTGGQSDIYQIKDWDNLRIYEMEPAFGHGGLLKTSYSKGIVKCYVEYKGKSDLLCTLDTGR